MNRSCLFCTKKKYFETVQSSKAAQSLKASSQEDEDLVELGCGGMEPRAGIESRLKDDFVLLKNMPKF